MAFAIIINKIIDIEKIDPRSSDIIKSYKPEILDVFEYEPEKSDIIKYIKYHEVYRIIIENAQWNENYTNEDNSIWESYDNYDNDNDISNNEPKNYNQ